MTSTRTVLSHLFEAGGAGDLDRVLGLWHEEGVLEDMTLDMVVTGKPAVTAYLRDYFSAFPGLSYTPDEIWAAGDHGVVTWRGTAHPASSFFGIPVSANTISLRGVDLFWVRDGTVVRERSWYGDGWLFQRLIKGQAGAGER
jgi:ketosteroid isomerase-like protein